MSRWRAVMLAFGTVLVFGMANLTIRDRQSVVDDGRPLLLRLAPVDPRSLIQGDYMRLRYDPAAYPEWEAMGAMPWRGRVILALDSDGVGRFARLDDGAPLAADEMPIAYRISGRFGDLRYGADSFFFQEGEAERYQGAVYGVLRVDADGDSVLVGLAGEDRRIIRPD